MAFAIGNSSRAPVLKATGKADIASQKCWKIPLNYVDIYNYFAKPPLVVFEHY